MTEQQQNIGKLGAIYFDEEALRLPPMPVYRITDKGNRNYFIVNEDRKAVLLDGVTTVVHATLPKSEFLIKWMAEKGYEEAKEYRDTRALYGTLMHTMLAHFIINGFMEVADIEKAVSNYCYAHNLTSVQSSGWVDDICSDLLAYSEFVREHNVKPLAIEVTLADTDRRVAGTVDLICLMDVDEKGFYGETYKSGDQKGQPKQTTQTFRRKAIIDFKSGRSGSNTEDKAAQLTFYKVLAIKNYPDMFQEGEIRMYNWSPKAWRSKPDYTLIDQTDNFTEHEIELMLELYRCRQKTKLEERTSMSFKGRIELGQDVTSNYEILTTADIVQQKIDEIVGERSKGTDDVMSQQLFPDYVYESFTKLITERDDNEKQQDQTNDDPDPDNAPATDRQGSLWRETEK